MTTWSSVRVARTAAIRGVLQVLYVDQPAPAVRVLQRDGLAEAPDHGLAGIRLPGGETPEGAAIPASPSGLRPKPG